jgi:prepilin-type N-terminal cleavage/methylation domain-containing protein
VEILHPGREFSGEEQAMRDARTRPTQRADRPARGFTLVELLVVMVIIGIIIGFILVAAQDAIRRAEEKATLSLINKLEIGVADRLEAILIRRGDVVQAHYVLAAIYNGAAALDPITLANDIPSPQRAQAIAQFDLVKAELPDVFFVQNTTGPYPINFAAIDYPAGSGNFAVPLGSALPTSPFFNSLYVNQGIPIGVYGATYQAAAGIYKNLGYLPAGYDGIDNNGNGAIDDMGEGVNATNLAVVTAHLQAHTHNTARSEMLYAMLVEGQGPLGSVFSRDEFTQREVQDTDGDGLPEFVDAWGQPLQFFRWPIYYNGIGSTGTTSSYVQKGMDFYGTLTGVDRGLSEVRQTDPLDPGQSLVALSWFSPASNMAAGAGANYSGGAAAFMTYFHSLLDPNFATYGGTPHVWDRSGASPRRAFYSRFLIVSSGPDKQLGVAQLNVNYQAVYSSTYGQITDNSGLPVSLNAAHLILIENQAAAIDPNRTGNFLEQPSLPGTNQTTVGLQTSGQDDITNQGLASPGGGVR